VHRGVRGGCVIFNMFFKYGYAKTDIHVSPYPSFFNLIPSTFLFKCYFSSLLAIKLITTYVVRFLDPYVLRIEG
jgi:hypothetical protein